MKKECKYLIVGPSHVTRWEHDVRCGALDEPFENTVFIGFAASPVWSKKQFNCTKKNYIPGKTKIILIVANYRFGNRILISDNKEFPLADGFTGTSKDAISPDGDRAMMKRCEAAIDLYAKEFSDDLTVVYWCLLGRQVIDMLAGRHLNGRKYTHPIWSIEAAIAHGRGCEYQLEKLLSLNPNQVFRLFLDNDIHPTFAGYSFLSNVLDNTINPIDNFINSLSMMEDRIVPLIRDLHYKNFKVAIIGDSIWIDILSRCLGPKLISDLRGEGITISNSSIDIFKKNIDDASEYKRIFLVTHGNPFEVRETAKRINLDVDNIYIFPWEPLVKYAFYLNGGSTKLQSSRNVFDFIDEPSMDLGLNNNWKLIRNLIESGPRGDPNIKGLCHVLNLFRRQIGL